MAPFPVQHAHYETGRGKASNNDIVIGRVARRRRGQQYRIGNGKERIKWFCGCSKQINIRRPPNGVSDMNERRWDVGLQRCRTRHQENREQGGRCGKDLLTARGHGRLSTK
jgi:hypothetical protein